MCLPVMNLFLFFQINHMNAALIVTNQQQRLFRKCKQAVYNTRRTGNDARSNLF